MTIRLFSSKVNLFYSLPQKPRPFLLPHHSSHPSTSHLFLFPSCIFGSNTNPQRPDCAYNPPWIDKPLISSLSPIPKDLGFGFFFLTSLWGWGFYPVETPDPKLSSGDPSERAVPSWQDQKALSSGNSAPAYMFRRQRRYETSFLCRCLPPFL